MAEKREDPGMTAPGARGSRKTLTGARGDGSAAQEPSKRGRGGADEPMDRPTPQSRKPDLKKDLRDFASARPEGWSHDDWLSFLESLQSRGHNIADRDAIGIALEKERLDLALGGVKGIGPQRRQALVERYGNLWSLRNANVDEIAQVGGMPRTLADRVKAEVP